MECLGAGITTLRYADCTQDESIFSVINPLGVLFLLLKSVTAGKQPSFINKQDCESKYNLKNLLKRAKHFWQ